jgi:hypothetical protein
VTWSEDDEAPVALARIPAIAWGSLCAVAARLWAGSDPEGEPGPDDEAVALAVAARPRDCRFYPILQAVAWIPASFDGVLPIGLPHRPEEGALASVQRLRSSLLGLNLECLRISPERAAAIRSQPYDATSSAVEAARFALAAALPAVDHAVAHGLPCLLAED